MKRTEGFYSGLVLAAAVLWGTTGTAQSFVPPGASPLSVGAVRLVTGAFAMVLFALAKGGLKSFALWKSRVLWGAALCVVAYQLLFFAGVLKTGVAAGTVVTIGSAPVFAGLLSLAAKRENPGLGWAVATLCAVAGCILLIGGGQRLTVDHTGVLLNLGAGFSYAAYTFLNKDLLRRHSPAAASGAVFALGAVLISPVLFLYDLSWLGTFPGAVSALHLGIAATAMPYVLFSYGLVRIPFPRAATLSLAEPMTAAILGILLLGERLSAIAWGGMLLVFFGLVVLAQDSMKRRQEAMR